MIENLICEVCMITCPYNHMQGHLDNQHADARIKIDKAKFEVVIEDLGVAECLPMTPVGIFPLVQGLKVYDGYKCPQCSKVFSSVAAARKHHQKDHKESGLPSEWVPCKMQQLNRGANNSYFEVILPPTQQQPLMEDEEIIAFIRSEIGITTEDWAISDMRQISPWLLSTGWHKHVADFEVQELRSLAAFPEADEFPGLGPAVHAYFKKATEFIDSTEDLILQQLNTADPAKT
jgi:hypothetical protein